MRAQPRIFSSTSAWVTAVVVRRRKRSFKPRVRWLRSGGSSRISTRLCRSSGKSRTFPLTSQHGATASDGWIVVQSRSVIDDILDLGEPDCQNLSRLDRLQMMRVEY